MRVLQAKVATAEGDALKQTGIMAYIGHDLRSPLSNIVGYARLMYSDATSTQVKHLQVIENEANQQLAMIDELLEYARGELDLLKLTVTEVDLPALLDAVQRSATSICSPQNIGFITVRDPGCPRRVMVDGGRLHQALLKLLCNVGASANHGVVSLRIGANQESIAWRLTFEIAGSVDGVPADNTLHTLGNSQEALSHAGDFGLGLFIAQKIVRRMGGELEQSVSAQGCRFTFDLRAAEPADRSSPNDWPDVPASAGMTVASLDPNVAVNSQVPKPQWATRPGHDSLRRLHQLASDGQWSEIEEWIGLTQVAQPEYSDFVTTINEALDAFDFETILRLSARRNA